VGDLDAEDETVVGVGQVPPVSLAVQGDVVAVGDAQQLFEILGLPHQAVGVIGDQMPDPAVGHLAEHLVPARALAVPLPGGAVVVHEDVHRGDDESQPLGDVAADSLLAVDARLVVVISAGDAAVDRCLLAGVMGCLCFLGFAIPRGVRTGNGSPHLPAGEGERLARRADGDRPPAHAGGRASGICSPSKTRCS
jgi:hypothetical protein